MKIVYRIINKTNNADDCLYELVRRGDLYLWQYVSRAKYNLVYSSKYVGNYPTIYLGMERNFEDIDTNKNEIAVVLRFEPADLEVSCEDCT